MPQEQGTGAVIFSLLGGILLFALVLVLAWFCTRWLGSRFGVSKNTGGSIHILERAAIGPDRSLMIVRVGGGVWLLGVTSQRIEALGQLDPEEYPEPEEGTPSMGPDFSAALQNALKGWTGGKKQEKDNQDE